MALRRFVNLYLELIGQLKDTFPSVIKLMPDYSEYEDMDFLRDFVVFNLPFIDDIATRDADSFKLRHKKAVLTKGIPFSKILEKSPPALVNVLFNYLRDLYIAAVETKMMLTIARKYKDEYLKDRKRIIKDDESFIVDVCKGKRKMYRPQIPQRDISEEISDDVHFGPGDMFISSLDNLLTTMHKHSRHLRLKTKTN